jgi:hypothetical protein
VPEPRATVVVKPPRKRGWADAAVGLVGLMLLVASGWLAIALPVHEQVPPQYKVSYLPIASDLPSQKAMFLEGTARTHEFAYEIPEDNVYQVKLSLSVRDDRPASRPDRFIVELFGPDGERVGAAYPVQTPETVLQNAPQVPPQVPPTVPEGSPAYVTPSGRSPTVTFAVGVKPDDAIVEDLNRTPEQIAQDLERAAHLPTQGTWRVKVTLNEAGDCATPPTPPTQEQALRYSLCLQEASPGADGPPQDAGRDPGNELTVGVFTYTRFAVAAEKL